MYFEQRKHERLSCKARVTIFNDTNQWTTSLVNVSRSGIRVRRPDGWLPGDALNQCEIQIGKKLKLRLDTRVAHTDMEHIGLRGDNENLRTLYDLMKLLALRNARDKADPDHAMEIS